MTERACWVFLMVIAARGEGVNVRLCLARRLPKNARKTTLDGVLGHAHTCRARLCPPLRQNSKKDRNIEAGLQFFLHTCATVLTHWLYDWKNNY
jgi:hypothetical protein